jgi:hypothetical protein
VVEVAVAILLEEPHLLVVVLVVQILSEHQEQ